MMKDWPESTVANAAAQIAASEDDAIFDALGLLGGMCQDSSHEGYKHPRSQCPHPDCVVRYVLDE